MFLIKDTQYFDIIINSTEQVIRERESRDD